MRPLHAKDICLILDLDNTMYNEKKHKSQARTQDDFYNSFAKDEELTRLLKACKVDKMLFTSANHTHSIGSANDPGIVRRMKLKTLFKKVLTQETYGMDKRNPALYPLAHKFFGLDKKACVLFFDDQVFNLKQAKKLNWITILIAESSEAWEKRGCAAFPSFIDYAFTNIHDALRYFYDWLRQHVLVTVPIHPKAAASPLRVVHKKPTSLPPRGNFIPKQPWPRQFNLHQAMDTLSLHPRKKPSPLFRRPTLMLPSPPPPPPQQRVPTTRIFPPVPVKNAGPVYLPLLQRRDEIGRTRRG